MCSKGVSATSCSNPSPYITITTGMNKPDGCIAGIHVHIIYSLSEYSKPEGDPL